MTYEQFVTWVWELVERFRLTPEQAEDLSHQRHLFDSQRDLIEDEFAGLVVGFIDGERVVRSGVVALLALAVNRYGGERQLYFEPVPPRVAPEGVQ